MKLMVFPKRRKKELQIHKNNGLAVQLQGYNNCFLTLRGSGGLRRTSESRRMEGTLGWRRLQGEEFHRLQACFSSSVTYYRGQFTKNERVYKSTYDFRQNI